MSIGGRERRRCDTQCRPFGPPPFFRGVTHDLTVVAIEYRPFGPSHLVHSNAHTRSLSLPVPYL